MPSVNDLTDFYYNELYPELEILETERKKVKSKVTLVLGAVGIAGDCRIMPVKVSDTAGYLMFSYIADGIYFAADNGADIISMSFGATTTAYAPMDAAVTASGAYDCVRRRPRAPGRRPWARTEGPE